MTPNTATLSLSHLVRPPATPPAPGTKPPILFLLHGVGSNERDLFGLASYLDDRFLIVSVRAPLTLQAGAYGWYPVHWTDAGPVGEYEKAEPSRQALLTFLPEAIAAYGADPDRVFLMGFSQGAIMSLYVALTAPELVKAVVPMSGQLIPPAWAARVSDDRLTDLPIFAVHGTRDAVLPVAKGREIREKLATLPVDLTYTEYEMAHEVSMESLRDITRWLTAQLDKIP